VPRLSAHVTCALLLIGALARVAALPWPGTSDVLIWEADSLAASRDLTGLYGVHGHIAWDDVVGPQQSDYPPVAQAEFAVVGHLYQALGGATIPSRLLSTLVKLPGVAAELVFVGVLLWWPFRDRGDSVVRGAALAFWLNPVVWLSGSALGYIDAQAAVPAVLAVLAASSGRAVIAGALVAIAALTKPQALFVLPAIVLVLRARPQPLGAVGRGALAGIATGVAVLLPFLVRGAGPNLVDAARRLGSHDMLSGNAANVWWIASWAARTVYHARVEGWWAAITTPMFIVTISRWTSFGYPSPFVIGWTMVSALWLWAIWQARRGLSPAGALVLAAWIVYAYAMFAPRVHENHLYLAVACLTVAAAMDRRVRVHWLASSVVFGLNLYLFYGLSDGMPPLVNSAWTGVDMTVLLAVASLVVFIRMTRFLPTACATPSRG
jgi:hypothetical protein